jgi:hypothetical protein
MKTTRREIVIAVNHLEEALISYLRPYFPEAVEIEGVDLELPISAGPGQVKAIVYVKQKDTKTVKEEVVKDDTPKVVDLVATKEKRKR